MKKYRIVNLKKFIRSISALLFIFIIMMFLFASATSSHNENIEYKIISVVSGDTLWSIASNEKKYNEYYYNKDIRYIVDDIKKANNMINSNIYEGQEILIPTL